MDMQERDFRCFHGLQPLSPLFFKMYITLEGFEPYAIAILVVGIDYWLCIDYKNLERSKNMISDLRY